MCQRLTQFICPFDYYRGRCPYQTCRTIPRQYLPNLSGEWYGINPNIQREGKTRIIQQGNNLTFINEVGDRSNGRFLNNRTVIATDWNNLQGTISDDLQRITWNNNTWWVRT